MSKILRKTLLLSPAVLAATLVASSGAAASDRQSSAETIAVEPIESEQVLAQVPSTGQNAPASTIREINRYSREGRNLRYLNRNQRLNNRRTSRKKKGQVTSVSQLSDVQPTDWAFQALQSLVERYGCIAGYPDGTYRGNRGLTRFEFAAGLNACLDRITELLQAALADTVSREDLAILERLQEEFAAELAILRGRVDGLEARIAELEVNQFSTTTKLTGEAIFAITDDFTGEIGDLLENNSDDTQTVFQNRVRLNLNTTFNGRDLLLTRLQVGNAQRFRPNQANAEGVQTFNVFGDTGGVFNIDKLLYRFPASERLMVTVSGSRGSWDDIAPTLNPYMEDFDGGSGSLSAFGQRNPIYRLGGGGGIGIEYDFGCRAGSDCIYSPTTLSLGYLASNTADASDGNGLFSGDYSALAQLTLTPSSNLQFALIYNKGYFKEGNFGFDNGAATGIGNPESFQSGFTGTGVANTLYGLNAGLNHRTPGSINRIKRVSSNSYGVGLSWRISQKFVLSGWGGLTDARLIGLGDAKIWYYGVTFAFPDLGRDGNLAGIVVGREPYLADLEAPSGLRTGLQRDESWHFEAFYKFQLTDNISLTPGVIWVTNPNQNKANDDVVIGTLRTTFKF